jgi:hypothetical protein
MTRTFVARERFLTAIASLFDHARRPQNCRGYDGKAESCRPWRP